MYACYIDESGHCGNTFNPEQPVEVVCGVITDTTKLFKTQREHSEILRFLDENNIPVSELKSSEIYRGRKHWSGVDHTVRHGFIDSLLEWAKDRSCKFIVCPIDSGKFFNAKKEGNSVAALLQFPFEAGVMNTVLAVERFKSGVKKNKGKTIVVLDEQHTHDGRIIRMIESDLEYTDGYTGYQQTKKKSQLPRLNEIFDVPFFSRSNLCSLIQIADLAAFIVNRYLLLTAFGKEESYEGELQAIRSWYSMIGDRLIPHTNISPTSKDELSEFYRTVRPDGWSAKNWHIE